MNDPALFEKRSEKEVDTPFGKVTTVVIIVMFLKSIYFLLYDESAVAVLQCLMSFQRQL